MLTENRPYLDLFLRLRVGYECRLELGAALAGYDRIVVVGLGDVELGAVGLPSSFNRARAEPFGVETALALDPADGTHVTDEDFKLRQLLRHR